MSLPAVTITESDGALGVLPAGQRLHAIAGVATSGPLNTPATFARTKDVIALFTAGPLVEFACHYITVYGKPVVLVRTAAGEAGTASAVDSVATGTSVVTVKATPAPKGNFEVVLLIVAPGTRGTTGVTYRLSYDGGRSYGPITELGTAVEIDAAEAGFIFALAAGDLDAGDTHTVVTTAPNFSPGEAGDAIEALKLTAADWEQLTFAGVVDGLTHDEIELQFAGLPQAGKYCHWVGGTRIPEPDESEAEYLTAMTTARGGRTTKYGAWIAGACKLPSAVSGRSYRSSFAIPVSGRQASVAEHVNIANVNDGPLVGVSIRDSNGNPDEHDEAINPGLDDAGFITARTMAGYSGVYITRPRLLAAEGSDFQLIPHRRVLNLGHIALRSYFTRRLNSPVLVDKVTGFILESEAREIEAGARAAMRSLLLATPKASGADFTLSRTDNILSTKTLTGQGRVIPLGYAEFINLDLSFYNPVNAVAA